MHFSQLKDIAIFEIEGENLVVLATTASPLRL